MTKGSVASAINEWGWGLIIMLLVFATLIILQQMQQNSAREGIKIVPAAILLYRGWTK